MLPSTIEANKRFFDNVEDVPRLAYSMGIKSIMKSKKIILMAYGETKAEAIKNSIEGPVTEEVPGSILQNHDNVIMIVDEEAAKLNPTIGAKSWLRRHQFTFKFIIK